MKDLLTRALDAHGGLSRWREIEAFHERVLWGVLWVRLSFLDNLPMASCSRRTETGRLLFFCLLKDIAGKQMRSAKISMKQYLPLSAT